MKIKHMWKGDLTQLACLFWNFPADVAQSRHHRDGTDAVSAEQTRPWPLNESVQCKQSLNTKQHSAMPLQKLSDAARTGPAPNGQSEPAHCGTGLRFQRAS